MLDGEHPVETHTDTALDISKLALATCVNVKVSISGFYFFYQFICFVFFQIPKIHQYLKMTHFLKLPNI